MYSEIQMFVVTHEQYEVILILQLTHVKHQYVPFVKYPTMYARHLVDLLPHRPQEIILFNSRPPLRPHRFRQLIPSPSRRKHPFQGTITRR